MGGAKNVVNSLPKCYWLSLPTKLFPDGILLLLTKSEPASFMVESTQKDPKISQALRSQKHKKLPMEVSD